MAQAITTRLTMFAAGLRKAGAIRSDDVERAFASVQRHRCVPEFRYGPQAISVAQDRLPDSEILDIVYSHRSLLTSTGHDGGLPSSSSAPTLMARMLEALDLQPGMRVMEIGAGTGYNAALITTITGAPVLTIDADVTTAHATAASIRRLGLDHQVTVLHGDGYLGAPASAPYDRIIATCGVTGLSSHWLDQLTPDGLILAPIAHGGVYPVLATSLRDGTRAKAVLWADFMPATGPLRPTQLAGHDPADYIPSAPITWIPHASPARTTATYYDLWFFLATRDDRITRAYLNDDSIDPSKGSCALHVPACGTAWVQTDGTIASVGNSAVAAELPTLIRAWQADGQPELIQFTCSFEQSGPPDQPLSTPHHWALDTETADRA